MDLSRYLWPVIGAAFIVGAFIYRARQASMASDRMARESAQVREWDGAIRMLPAWGTLAQMLGAQGVYVANGPPQPGQFVAKLLTTWSVASQRVAPSSPEAAWLNAYLSGPKNIVASLDLRTGQCHVRDCGSFEWPVEAG